MTYGLEVMPMTNKDKEQLEILDIKQNTPDSLLREAKQLYQKAKRSGNPYDRVYCVFDKDGHSKYQETRGEIFCRYSTNSLTLVC
jgi:hypothetical protein